MPNTVVGCWKVFGLHNLMMSKSVLFEKKKRNQLLDMKGIMNPETIVIALRLVTIRYRY